MDWRHTVAALGTGLLVSIAMLGAATAQSDRDDGRLYTPEHRPAQATEAPAADRKAETEQPVRRRRAVSTELPRGPTNIPWDEPGKLSGVPGVFENPATSLPQTRTARPTRDPDKRSRAAAQTPSDGAEELAKARPGPERAAARPEPGATARTDARQQHNIVEPNKPQEQNTRLSDHPSPVGRGDPAQAAGEAEARAKVIEQFKARALAEEQRRLETEQSRDRHARRPEWRPASQAKNGPERPAQPRSDPEATGAVPPAPETAYAEPEPSGWSGVCKMLFFGLLRGC